MALLDIWRAVPAQVASFGIGQVVNMAGNGILLDGSDCSTELRGYLAEITDGKLIEYALGCLDAKFEARGLALQDIVNEMGRRLGFRAENGRYRGAPGEIGFDGLWKSPENDAVVVEVKTSDTYSINLDTIAAYRAELVAKSRIGPQSSMLVVVGSADTGSLEAQVRGSRHAWDMRLISVAALGDLVRLNAAARSQQTTKRIRTLLTPREFTRLDGLTELLLLTAEETADAREQQLVGADETVEGNAPQEVSPSIAASVHVAAATAGETRTIQVTDPAIIAAKRSSIVAAVEVRSNIRLVKQSRATYASADGHVRLACTISKRYTAPRYVHPYWFAYHPIWRDFLLGAESSFLALGFADGDRAAVIPASFMESLLPALNTTTPREGGTYWHLHLLPTAGGSLAIRLRDLPPADLGDFMVALAPSA